jgi:hypothetical protein
MAVLDGQLLPRVLEMRIRSPVEAVRLQVTEGRRADQADVLPPPTLPPPTLPWEVLQQAEVHPILPAAGRQAVLPSEFLELPAKVPTGPSQTLQMEFPVPSGLSMKTQVDQEKNVAAADQLLQVQMHSKHQ